MEQKRFDKNTIIGFVLIFGIVMWMSYNSTKKAAIEAETKAKVEKAKKIQELKSETTQAKITSAAVDTTKSSDVKIKELQSTLGGFAYSATLPTAKEGFTTLENELVVLKIANKGGYISEVTLKEFQKFHKNSGELVSLIKNNNAGLNIQLQTKDNRVLNTKDLFFEPTLSKIGENQVLSMKLKAGANEFLEYKYVLKPNDYMLDYDVHSQGLNSVLNESKPAELVWDLKSYKNEKSVTTENTNAEIYFEHKEGKIDYVGQGKDASETAEKTTYISYKQHFFSSILITDTPFETSKLESNSLVNDSKVDTVFIKQFKSTLPLAFKNGELDYKMNLYHGPTDYALLKSYEKNLEDSIPLGWGIIGWINKYIFSPLFGFLGGYMNLGIAIIIFTLLIKLAMSPITFKSFMSQAKMKVLRPEISALNDKFGKDAMKKQQETMALYNKAGVNPMAGCIPALIQMPFLMASFKFFPTAIELRQKGFLWADDLSSFDQIVKLPFNIPLYGDHISLFPILAAIAIFFYMKMTSGDNQAMAQPTQEGMPDMGKMMKIMIYVSPLMMLIFFNSYGSGLSLYNLISNLVTIGIMLVIKNYIIDDKKILAQIEVNKTKPKSEGKFQKKMREIMEQAEEQKKLGKK